MCELNFNFFFLQVCRLAYAIMNSFEPDASTRFTSLDDIYIFSDQKRRLNIAVLPHKANGKQEMDLQVGDEISVVGNLWNGYSKGINLRTNEYRLYPTFKVTPNVVVVIPKMYIVHDFFFFFRLNL